MIKPLALERGISRHRGPVGGQWSGGLLHRGILRGRGSFVLSGDLVYWGIRRYVKESSGNGHLSPYRPRWETRKGLVYRGLCETDQGCSGNGTSISMGVLRREPGGRAPLLSILKDIYRKAMETGICLHKGSLANLEGGGGHLPGTLRDTTRGLCRRSVSLYGSSVMGTWRDRSISGNSASYVRHLKEGFGNGARLSL